jgi:hypothetical protein
VLVFQRLFDTEAIGPSAGLVVVSNPVVLVVRVRTYITFGDDQVAGLMFSYLGLQGSCYLI